MWTSHVQVQVQEVQVRVGNVGMPKGQCGQSLAQVMVQVLNEVQNKKQKQKEQG